MIPCDDLDIFFDGELPADRAQAFRVHLATCTRCQRTLRGRMLEAVVMEHSAENCPCPALGDSGQYPDQLAARRRSRRWTVMVAAVAASVALISKPQQPDSTAMQRPATERPAILALAEITLAPKRPVDVRFSTRELDGHRPPDVLRSTGPSTHERITSATLAELERQGHANAYVAALALKGDVNSAREAAAKLPNTPQSLSDRAAVELLGVDDTRELGLKASQQQAAEQALSLAAAALQLDPQCVQAMWNRAVALRRLQLPLAAADAFDEIAKRGEPGWSSEARDTAERLRNGYKAVLKEQTQLKDDADRMVAGGPAITAERARFSPSLARRALYQALATASTADRLDTLLPLAQTLDAAYPTATLVALVQQIRRSNLAQRAPIARSLGDFIARRTAHQKAPLTELRAIRTRASRPGFTDIALATFLVQSDWETEDPDLDQLGKLVATQDAWWQGFEIMRRTYALQYKKRDYFRAEQMARSAASLCQSTPTLWCERLTMFAGAANAELGRLDVALELLSLARQLARQPATRDDEALALDVTGQVMVLRVQAAIDSVAVSDAYFTEYALRQGTCDARLSRLDSVATAALDRHRYAQAVELRSQADALESGECKSIALGLNGETVRLRLALTGHEDVEKLRQRVRVLEEDAEHRNSDKYIRYLRAATIVSVDRARGESALLNVITDADLHPDEPFASLARSTAYSTLIEVAAQAREPDNVIALLGRRLGVAVPQRCTVGIAQWNRVAIAVRGADGASAIETRELPAGQLMFSSSELVPVPLQERLAGCRRVEVLTSGPYFGMANILGTKTPWVYKSSSGAARLARGGSELVITDVTPPEETRLPELRSFRGPESAVILKGARATPSATLESMRTAGLIVIVAHGLTDTREPSAASLILSPDEKGDYLLTASKVSTAHLDNAPVVVLAGCEAGRVQISAEPWSLATSFLAAGARAVIAPTEKIPDDEASVAFDSLVARIRSGTEPVDALQAERGQRGRNAAWLSSIVVFE